MFRRFNLRSSMRTGKDAFGCLIRILLVVAAGFVIITVYNTCSGTPLITKIDKTLPAIEAVPYEAVTVTRTLLTVGGKTHEDGSVTLFAPWYDKDEKGKWRANESEITLPAILHPRLQKRQ